MKLAFALTFKALCSDEGPGHLDRLFVERFGAIDDQPDPEGLIGRARHCETLISELFGLDEALTRYRQRDADFALLQTVKYKFVKRKGILGSDPEQLAAYDPAPAQALWRRLSIVDDQGRFDELAFARTVGQWQATGPNQETAEEAATGLQMAARYSAWACLAQAGRHLHRGQVLFNHAQGVDPETLLHGLDTAPAPEGQRRVIRIQPALREPRPGFDLTDAGPSPAHGLDQARYCLICHPTQTDSCSHGLKRKDGHKEPAAFARNALGVELGGCPLGERISEFQSLRREGRPIAALAMIMRDNPMVAATGHRICNDCSRACVFQQQSPVDIPGGETRILEDVLALPWGVEIYSLLTRWNPLRPPQSRCRGDSGRKVLVVGLGPAGFTLAHHLLNQGHQVVAIDGQKIEPLAPELLSQPVESWAQFQESLAERTPTGFGGVTEYGITVRWNKNYLKLIRLTLERRSRFRMMGGVRLGAQLRLDDAFTLGFDHVALALGAGKPRLWDIPGALPRGVRMASDFLMALQLGGLSREDSVSSLQIELPLVVIGAGLTAVDTATEALAWYALQVERFARRHALLVADPATAKYLDALPATERERAERFIEHGQAIQATKELAALEANAASQGAPDAAAQPDSRATPAHEGADQRASLRIRELLQSWGGVTLVYRAPLRNSPAYRLNHDELQKALAEGIQVLENCVVSDVRTDDGGSLQALQLTTADTPQATAQWLPVRSALLAVGTGHSTFGDEASDAAVHAAVAEHAVRAGSIQALRDEKFLAGNDPRVTCFGDMHRFYSGSVVRAMASAARGALLLDGLLGRTQGPDNKGPTINFKAFADTLAGQWQARLCGNESLAKGIYELAIDAPAAASRFQPGQFFRLQDFEASGPRATEPMAMTGAEVTAGETGSSERLRTIILQSGTSTALASRWAPGRPLILMGPCGEPSEIPSGQKVLLVGGGLGNAVLFSIGKACRAKQCDVTYIAGYRSAADVFRRDALEAAADRILWCFEQSGAPETQFKSHIRPQDQMFAGNVLQAMRHLSTKQAGSKCPALGDIGHLLVIGSDGMMAALASACKGEFAPLLQPELRALASVNAPMQCMMKGICGQCLQAVTDPVTGVVRHVFACEQQDQPLRDVDFAQLHARLQQNRVLETQNSAWLARNTRS